MAAETQRYVQAVLAHLADNIPKVGPQLSLMCTQIPPLGVPTALPKACLSGDCSQTVRGLVVLGGFELVMLVTKPSWTRAAAILRFCPLHLCLVSAPCLSRWLLQAIVLTQVERSRDAMLTKLYQAVRYGAGC